MAALDWEELGDRLTRDGCVLIPGLVDVATCAGLRGLFDEEAVFAKTVVMDRPEFGRGVGHFAQRVQVSGAATRVTTRNLPSPSGWNTTTSASPRSPNSFPAASWRFGL